MPAPLPDRAKSVFLAALDVPAEDARRAHVEAACAGDEALRHAVEQLLRHHGTAGAFLEPPVPAPGVTADLPPAGTPTAAPADPAGAEQPGLVLAGRYKLLEPVGEGGMGRVWTAHQTEPVKRLVAVKLIKAGMDSKAVLARFDAERQALAMMDHPNIAKVLDAGTTPDGRPFFAMELVKGVPITTYCDDHKLTPRQRLELFVPVCQAIQHAHQKGVIHRDIKPSNVMIALYDDRPVPKVIDFGVAKATGQSLTERTLHTGLGAVVGTPEYMSPEQASFNNLDVDTRSDVYSLGVLLYELLAGSPPFSRKDLERAGLLEVLRVVREQEPPRPSTKLSTADGLPSLAASRGTEPRKLCGLLRGELDWIVMKALEKDRARRYDTANGFAADLQRYLADETVQACPPSAGYRLRKFARRNTRALTAACALAGSLVVAVAALAISYAQVNEALFDRTAALGEKDRALDAETAALGAETDAKNTLRDALDRETDTVYAQGVLLADHEWLAGNVANALETLDSLAPEKRRWEWHYLRRRCRTEGASVATLAELARASVVLSPDGGLAAVTTAAGIDLRDARTGRPVRSMSLGRITGHGAVFSGDGEKVAAATQGDKVVVWEVATGKLVAEIQTAKLVWMVTMSHDGSRLLAARPDASSDLWDALTGKKVRELRPLAVEPGRIQAPPYGVFSPDGRLALIESEKGRVRIVEADTGAEVQTIHKAQDPFTFARAGQIIAGYDYSIGSMAVWDVKDGRRLAALGWPSGKVAFSPDGTLVASVGSDRLVRVQQWEAAPPRLQVFRGHRAAVTSFVFRDNERLASLGADGRVLDWDMRAGQEHRVFPLGNFASKPFALAPDGRHIVTDRFVWNSQLRPLRFVLSDRSDVSDVVFSGDGLRLLSLHKIQGQGPSRAKVWEVATGKGVSIELGGPISGVCLSPDGRTVVARGLDGTLRLLDADTGQESRILAREVFPNSHAHLAFSADGRWLAVTKAAGDTVEVLDLGTGRRVWSLAAGRRLGFLVFSPDCRFGASSVDGGVVVWDLATGRVRFTLADLTPVQAVAVSPDGGRLSVLLQDGLRVYDTAAGRPLLSIRLSPGWSLKSLTFSPDGHRLIAAGGRGVWEWDGTPLPGEARKVP